MANKNNEKPLRIPIPYEDALKAFLETPPPPREKKPKKKAAKKRKAR